jgi:hypothetical protein
LAQVIDAVDMICVAVGVDNRIQRADTRIKQLAAHIGSGIDQDCSGAFICALLNK